MSTEDAESFIKKVMTDETLRDQLNERVVTDDFTDNLDEETVRRRLAETVPELASEHGYEFTPEQGFKAISAVREKLQSEELSDAELEQVAGGITKEGAGEAAKIIGVTAGTLVIGCIVSLAQENQRIEQHKMGGDVTAKCFYD